MERFSHLVLRVYFSKTFSEAEFIIANAGLMWLLQEQAYHVPEQMEEANSFAQLCSVNLERGLLNLPLHLPANSTMIFALVLGVRILLCPILLPDLANEPHRHSMR